VATDRSMVKVWPVQSTSPTEAAQLTASAPVTGSQGDERGHVWVVCVSSLIMACTSATWEP